MCSWTQIQILSFYLFKVFVDYSEAPFHQHGGNLISFRTRAPHSFFRVSSLFWEDLCSRKIHLGVEVGKSFNLPSCISTWENLQYVSKKWFQSTIIYHIWKPLMIDRRVQVICPRPSVSVWESQHLKGPGVFRDTGRHWDQCKHRSCSWFLTSLAGFGLTWQPHGFSELRLWVPAGLGS